jgi:radical SAM superfamily enzyme YgiQ (UPF0313 family)
MNVLLISTYEMGRQPFGLASPAAWLRQAGAKVRTIDLSQQPLDECAVSSADIIAFYLPMHTATRISTGAIQRVRVLNPAAHLCCYGLYAPMNEAFLRSIGVQTVFGGEFERPMVNLLERLMACTSTTRGLSTAAVEQPEPLISLARQQFVVPDREGLPPLEKYASLTLPDGTSRTVGYTEASRGCKYKCRHCPVVPVYEGQFRIVQPDIVLEDIRRQVGAGARHITFGDPDFFNGIKHAIHIVTALHQMYPSLTYDVTIKVEHLLKHARHLELLKQTGCAFVTTAVESFDDRVLMLFDKGHTSADFNTVLHMAREIGLTLAPTFVAFHPWMTLKSYEEFLETILLLDLVENVSPVQLAIRLLIPSGSYLLRLPEIRQFIGPFEGGALSYCWAHPDPRVDALQRDLQGIVQEAVKNGAGRRTIFDLVWRRLQHQLGDPGKPLPAVPPGRSRATIPYLEEPWYC